MIKNKDPRAILEVCSAAKEDIRFVDNYYFTCEGLITEALPYWVQRAVELEAENKAMRYKTDQAKEFINSCNAQRVLWLEEEVGRLQQVTQQLEAEKAALREQLAEAQADNAALIETVKRIMNIPITPGCECNHDAGYVCPRCKVFVACNECLDNPHPGAALRKELEQLRTENERLMNVLIDKWHKSDGQEEVYEYMEMTQEEYGHWVEK